MIPPAVLAAFRFDVRECTWIPLPPGGGLSGGRVWRGDSRVGPNFALKKWPASHTPERMRLVHERMRVADFEFVPSMTATQFGNTLVVHGDRCWDVTTWMHGTPDLLAHPSLPQLRAAGAALAELHRVWRPVKVEYAPCSAVSRRLTMLAEWERTRFGFTGRSEDVAEVEATLELVRTRLHATRIALLKVAPLHGRVVGIHGDFWPENVLFQHERLTGVIDFGNVGSDHPEVDLGRLFADVPGADRRTIAAAVAAYNSNAPFDLSVPLVELLATSGRLGSLANWHLRLNAGSPDSGLLPAALPRIRRLVSHVLVERE